MQLRPSPGSVGIWSGFQMPAPSRAVSHRTVVCLAGVSRPEDYNSCNKALKQLSGMRHLLHSMGVCMFKGSEL